MSIILDVNWTKKYVFVHKCTFNSNKIIYYVKSYIYNCRIQG